jgi:hypothetical protein
MNEHIKLNHLTKNEIDTQTREMKIELNILRLSDEQFCFFPLWIFTYNNDTLNAESPYAEFFIKGSDINKLIKEAELKAMISAIKNSPNSSKEIYIYLLNWLYYNWVFNSSVANNNGYSWEIYFDYNRAKICWDKYNSFVDFKTEKRGFFKIKNMTETVMINEHIKIAEKIMMIINNNTYRSRVVSKSGLTIVSEMHPDDKKEIYDEVKKIIIEAAKKQMTKNYEGFAIEYRGRGGYIFYKKNGKIIVAGWELSFGKPDYACTKAALEKWTYPNETLLTDEETKQLFADMEEYNKTHKETIGT